MENNLSAEQRAEKAREWGAQAEQIAFEYFVRSGYVVRERNWRTGASHLEVDMILEREGTIVFVEVKARSGKWNDGFAAVDEKKIRNLVRAADKYITANNLDFEYRFDIVVLHGTPSDHTVTHIEDAFLPPL